MSKQLLIESITNQKFSPKTDGDKYIVEGILTRKDEKRNHNGRIYPEETLLREVEKYKNTCINQNRAMGELDHPDCVSSCLIMTNNGWKDIKNIKDDEIVATLNFETNKIEYHQITEKISKPYKGKMYHIKGKNIDITVTPNHRFVVRNRKGILGFETADNLYTRIKNKEFTHLEIPKSSLGWDFNSQDKFILKGCSINQFTKLRKDIREKYCKDVEIDFDVWMGFIGIYLAEGHFGGCRRHEENTKGGYKVCISQKNPEKKIKIKELLSKFPEEFHWKETATGFQLSDARLHNYLSVLGSCYTKYIPHELKNQSPQLLNELLDWFHLGDGRTTVYKGYSSKDVFSTSQKLIEDLHEILTKTGGVGNITVDYPKKDYLFAERLIKAENKKPLWFLNFQTSKSIHLDPRFIKIEEINDFDNYVYCVKVPNETFYAMSEGKCFWSGNSSVINLKNVSHNIQKCWWDGDDLIGKIEILKTPCGNIARALFEAKIPVGISSRALGTTKNISEGTVEVQDDLELLAFDLVSVPSCPDAFLSPSTITEGINPNLLNRKPENRMEEIIREILTTLS